MDWQQHLRETAEYLVEMASRPGWRRHAVHRRDELLADLMYEGLLEEIRRVQGGGMSEEGETA